MASKADRQKTTGRTRHSDHESFLRYRGFLWLKIAFAASFLAILLYGFNHVEPRANGGSAYGYIMGTIGAGLILWLTLLGARKRTITPGRWSLKAWTSAHVYLGLALIVIATLHTGFQFGWNVHTLAYALMMFVIISGIFGITAYSLVPQELSANRGETTQVQMLDNLRMLDRQIHDAAQPLNHDEAEMVQYSLNDDPFAGGLIARLSGNYPKCGTKKALDLIRAAPGRESGYGNDALDQVETLLERKRSSLSRIRKHLRLKALLEVWLYIHVPLTFALIAALFVHIFAVFYYW
ncbi:hypothetical protein [Sphingomonas montanisoli]|uniref:Ferric reductase like transmembrane component n=1 Tax=Sphingomonas montanisoli TaxID=2606412 RepID=A0A5D9C0N9_9SPHN|nr:hypothetical protein [Sphingomonas montanisoli]TZG24737.1 hypothetical protein FYJ91_19205 [Sphingomonas montanisoli]